MFMRRIICLALLPMLICSALPLGSVSAADEEYLWLEAEDILTDGVGYGAYTVARVDSGSVMPSGGKIVSLCTEEDGTYSVTLPFEITDSDNYDIFMLSTDNWQPSYASPYEWSLNGGAYSNGGVQTSYTAVALPFVNLAPFGDIRGGLRWWRLRTQDLEPGVNSLSIRVTGRREQENIYCHMIDVLVIVPSSWGWTPDGYSKPYDKRRVKVNPTGGSISAARVDRKSTFTATVGYRPLESYPSLRANVWAELSTNGETVRRIQRASVVSASTWTANQTYTEAFTIDVPFNAPDGIYEVRYGIEGINFQDGKPYALLGTIQVGNDKEVIIPYTGTAELTELTAAEGEIMGRASVTLDRAVDFESAAYLTLWRDDILWGVAEAGVVDVTAWKPGEAEEVSFAASIPDGMPKGDYDVRLGLHIIDISCEPIMVNTGSGRSDEYKPLSYGSYYAKNSGKSHFWYVNQVSALIWDGEPYVPIGGVVSFNYIIHFDVNAPEGNERRWGVAMEELAVLKENNIRDIYIQPVSYAPIAPSWAWNWLLDYLEEEGFIYSIQASISMARRTVNAYYPISNVDVTSNIVDIDNYQRVPWGGGAGEVMLDNFNLVFDSNNPKSALFTVVEDSTGNVVQSGRSRPATVSADKQTCSFVAGVDVPPGAYHVFFAPETESRWLSMVNFWDDGDYLLDVIDNFTAGLSMGDNFRSFIDPLSNEIGIANANSQGRIHNPAFNADMAEYLRDKYKDIANLNRAWMITPELQTFAEASRLVPVSTVTGTSVNYTYYLDTDAPDTTIYKAETRNGLSWNDFLDTRDDLFGEFMNTAADVFKKNANVPVVNKHTAPQRRYFVNKKLKGGFDGIGGEPYGIFVGIKNRSYYFYSHADQSARTTWTIVTETNTEEDVPKKYAAGLANYDPDTNPYPPEWVYPSKEYMFEHFNTLLDCGAKGIFDFLLLTDPLDLQFYHGYSYIYNRHMFDWRNEFEETYMTPERIDEMMTRHYKDDVLYFYPQGRNLWWYRPNEKTLVYPEDDISNIRSLYTGTDYSDDGYSVLPTDNVDVPGDILFVNLINAPSTNIYGEGVREAIAKGDRRIVVLGHRNNLGALPEIDKYYTAEKVNSYGLAIGSNRNYQVLNLAATDTAVVLKEAGIVSKKPWALRDGNLWIIADEDFYVRKNAAGTVTSSGDHYFLKYMAELGATEFSTVIKPSPREFNESAAEFKNFAWIEAETPDSENPFVVDSEASASGGALLKSLDNEGVNYLPAEYDFELSESDDYDIWYLGDGGNSLLYWDLDLIPSVNGEPVNTDGANGMAWHKIASGKKILSGEHTLSLCWRRTSEATGYSFEADCIAVVPASWDWIPADGHPDKAAAELDNISIYEEYFSKLDLDNLKESLLYSGAVGQAGSIFAYLSENTAVLDDDGTLTRPSYAESDVSFTFSVTAQKGGQSDVREYGVTVIKRAKYAIDGFGVYGEDGVTPLEGLTAGANVFAKAHAALWPPDTSGTVTLIIALYNREEELCMINADRKPLGALGEELQATLTMPGDIDGYTLKAFVWDDAAGLLPQEKAIEIP